MRKAKAKMSRSTLLLVLCTIFVGLLLAIVLVGRLTAPDSETPPPSTGGTDPIVLAEVADTDITAITIQNGSTRIALVKNGSHWELAENAAYPLDTDAVAALVTGCAKITASKKVTDLTETSVLSLYGLHAPYTISVTAGDTNYAVELGSKYSTGNSYYFRMQGGTVLYRMENAEALSLRTTLTALTYGAKLPAVYADTLHTVQISDGADLSLTYTKEETPDLVTQILLAVTSIDTKLYADVAPTEEALAAYGFSAPTARTLMLKTTREINIGTGAMKDEDFTFHIGNTVTVTIDGIERQLSYVQIPDQPYVYYLDTTVLDNLPTT